MDKVAEQLPSMGTALAGLILVFLGVIVTGWDSYDTQAKKAVQGRFRLRAWLAFLGFFFSIIAAGAGLIGIGLNHTPPCADYVGLVALGISGALMVVLGLLVVLEI